MRASTQYSNTQKRKPTSLANDDVPIDQVPQQELVLKHADLVKRIAYHLVSRMPPNVEVDDLIQSGMIGLLDAAKHYSATKGANFETYAGIRIRGAMLDEVRKSDRTSRACFDAPSAASNRICAPRRAWLRVCEYPRRFRSWRVEPCGP